MRKTIRPIKFAITFAALLSAGRVSAKDIAIDPAVLQPRNVKVDSVNYKGRKTVRIADSGPTGLADGASFALVSGTDFQDGILEIDLAGDTEPGAAPEFRGFTGLAFRVSSGASKYECFYLRPKNGRSEDQLQRNHSAQYISFPDFGWKKLRDEFPGKYESYVDLVAGEWTHVKIAVQGTHAKLFVNQSAQPVLLVNDLKSGVARGAVALWVGPKTVAHFTNLRVSD